MPDSLGLATNDLSGALLGCLPLILWLVIIVYAVSWLSSRILPRNVWLRRSIRTLARLIFIEPFRQTYRAMRWLVVHLFTTNPTYRFHQIYLERYPVTPLELYAMITDVFATRQIIGVQIRRVARLEWHLLSTRRIYLLIQFRGSACFISAIPMGTGIFITWRYSAMPSKFLLILFEVPIFGVIAERLLAPPTFYRTDVYQAFEESVRECVIEATRVLTQRGVRALNETERRPLLREFYH